MKKHILVSLVLALVLMLALASTALAAYCMNCGVELPSEAKYCYNCGTKVPDMDNPTTRPTNTPKPTATPKPTTKPTATPRPTATPKPTATPAPASSLKITKISDLGNGTIRVQWSDSSSNGPYTVLCMQKRTSDYDDDEDTAVTRWIGAEDVYGKYADVNIMVPGQDYWIIVEDSDGNEVHKAYNAQTLSHFYEFNTTISMQLKYRRNGSYEEVNSFSASDIKRNRDNTTYGAYIRLDYPQLARERHYNYMVAIKAPTGEVFADSIGEMELSYGRSYTYWSYFSFDWYFGIFLDNLEYVPTGTYTFMLYYDGMMVSSHNFRVSY